jgi:hypothetical protein
MRGARSFRIAAALAVALALVGRTLVGAFGHAPTAVAAAGLVDPVLGPLSICASAGPDFGSQGGAPVRDDQSGHCPACALPGGPATPAIALASSAVVFPAAPDRPCCAVGARIVADHLSLGGIRSRAPPLRA